MQSKKAADAETVNRLISEVRAGGSDAFMALSDVYKPLLSAEIAPYTKELSAHDLADLKQGALIAFYRAALTYDTGKKDVTFGLYAKVCVKNGILDTLRYVARHRDREVCTDELPSLSDAQAGENPQQLFLDRQQIAQMYATARRILSPLEYRIFTLYMSGFSYTEIAAKLERTPKSVDNALTRIKRKIKEQVNSSAD